MGTRSGTFRRPAPRTVRRRRARGVRRPSIPLEIGRGRRGGSSRPHAGTQIPRSEVPDGIATPFMGPEVKAGMGPWRRDPQGSRPPFVPSCVPRHGRERPGGSGLDATLRRWIRSDLKVADRAAARQHSLREGGGRTAPARLRERTSRTAGAVKRAQRSEGGRTGGAKAPRPSRPLTVPHLARPALLAGRQRLGP
jgi:hypothetical protein